MMRRLSRGLVAVGLVLVLQAPVRSQDAPAFAMSGGKTTSTMPFEFIDNAVGQRFFGTNHGQIDLLLRGETRETGEVARGDIDRLRHLVDTGAATGAVEAPHRRALVKAPA